MLLCFDVYVWIPAADRGAGLARFMDRYVDTDDPGDARLDAVVRTLVHGRPGPGDGDALADLRGPGAPGAAFSVYLRARRHHEAIVTLTEEGDLVLGLGIDDPLDDLGVVERADALLSELMRELPAVAGIGGEELGPPQSAAEWRDDPLVVLRRGDV